MKIRSIKPGSPFKSKFLAGIFLLFSIMFSSYKSTACTASFTYTAGVNGHYTFTSTSVGVTAHTYYSWNPGDGSGWHYYQASTFNYTYLTNGFHIAYLLIQDSSVSCLDTIGHGIIVSNVGNPCLLAASFTHSVGAHGVVTFTSTSTGTDGSTQYYWSPGDSNQRIHGTTTLTHKYLFQGYYFAWLTLKDTGHCTDSASQYFYVSTADSAHNCGIHANFTYIQGGNGQITFTNTSTGVQGPGIHYTWTMGDTVGTYSAKGPFNYIYASNNTYMVKLYIRNDSGCIDSIVLPVTVTSACGLHASFTYVYDSNGQVHFTSTSAGANGSTVYKWIFGDGSPTLTGHDTATHGYPFLGYYDVTLVDSNGAGCTSSSTQQIYIYNKDSLQACFTYIADSTHAGKYNFNAGCSKGTYPYTYYKWTPGDGDPSDSGLGMTTYTHTYLHNGPYSATLTIWYTILPHKPMLRTNPEYDLSSVTQIINVSTVTGIASVTDSKTYTIYPNPNNGSFTIAVNGMAGEKNAQVRISNMMGQVVYNANTNISGNTLTGINMPNAANGIYLLQIITADNTYTSRIAIQR